jgi:FKBP-type peptidyl-prolyl cis-trans isomerase (trigger factor)
MSHSHHHHDIDFKKAFTVTKEAGSQVKIAGEIPFAELANERSAAIKSLGKNVELDGFRKGHVPENILVKHIGEMAILAEMAERAIAHMYPHILEAHEVDAIGYPKIEITKIAPENPLGFTATVAVLPEVKLPDYKKLAADINKDRASDEVTDAEVDEKINDVLRQKAAYERLQKKATGEDTTITPEGEDVKLDIPELTDEVAKSLGQPGQFESVADLKAKLKEHLTIEKKQDNSSIHRGKITDAIIDGSTIELPQILIDSELGQMFAQMEEDLKRANLKMDDYLAHIKKTKEDLKTEWTPSAEKRAKLQLILNEIAKAEKVEADKTAIDNQVAELLTMYKDADEHRVRTYVASVLTNEAVMKMLEEAK